MEDGWRVSACRRSRVPTSRRGILFSRAFPDEDDEFSSQIWSSSIVTMGNFALPPSIKHPKNISQPIRTPTTLTTRAPCRCLRRGLICRCGRSKSSACKCGHGRGSNSAMSRCIEAKKRISAFSSTGNRMKAVHASHQDEAQMPRLADRFNHPRDARLPAHRRPQGVLRVFRSVAITANAFSQAALCSRRNSSRLGNPKSLPADPQPIVERTVTRARSTAKGKGHQLRIAGLWEGESRMTMLTKSKSDLVADDETVVKRAPLPDP